MSESDKKKPWGLRVYVGEKTIDVEGMWWIGHGIAALTVADHRHKTEAQNEFDFVKVVFAPGAWDRFEVLEEDPEAVEKREQEERRVEEAVFRFFQSNMSNILRDPKYALMMPMEAYREWKKSLTATALTAITRNA